MAREKETEKLILDTATELFGERGKNGVGTAEIAKKAGVNKAMIFYYFDSKDDLYRAAFKKTLEEFIGTISNKISGVEPGLPMVEAFVREHIAFLQEKQIMVKFIVRELIMAEDEMSPVLKESADVLINLRNDLLKAISFARNKGEIRDVDPFQTIVNIISLDIFFFLGKPIVELINPNIDSEDFENKRIDHVLDLLMNGLRKHPE